MGKAVISSNTTLKIEKKSYVQNLGLSTTPQTLLSVGSNEYVDIYSLSATYTGGATTVCTVECVDNTTGVVYYTATSPIATVVSTSVPALRLLPNTTLRAKVLSNIGNFDFKYTGIATVNSP